MGLLLEIQARSISASALVWAKSVLFGEAHGADSSAQRFPVLSAQEMDPGLGTDEQNLRAVESLETNVARRRDSARSRRFDRGRALQWRRTSTPPTSRPVELLERVDVSGEDS